MLRIVPGSDRSQRKIQLAPMTQEGMKVWFARLVHIEVDGYSSDERLRSADQAADAVYFAMLDELLHNWLVAKDNGSLDRPAQKANGHVETPLNRLLHVTDRFNSSILFWNDRIRYDEVGGIDVSRYDLRIDGLHQVDHRSLIHLAFTQAIQYEYQEIEHRSFRRLIYRMTKKYGAKKDDVYAVIRERFGLKNFNFYPCFCE